MNDVLAERVGLENMSAVNESILVWKLDQNPVCLEHGIRPSPPLPLLGGNS